MPGNRGFSVSANGRFVFLAAPKTEPQLTWVDRSGRPVETVGAPGFSGGNLDLSPDGQQLAFAKPGNLAEPQVNIWLIELATGRATPLTDDLAGDYDPAWSPDGKYIVFNSARPGGSGLFLRASDGSGVDVPLAKVEKSEANSFTVASWSRADVLIFNVLKKDLDFDLGTLSMAGDRTPRVFVSSKQSELNGTFSPTAVGSLTSPMRRTVTKSSSGRSRTRTPRELSHVMAGSFPAGEETARSFSSCRPPGR